MVCLCLAGLSLLLLLHHQVVDFVTNGTYGELADGAVSSDPLLLLPCGHVFATSTLDGWVDIGAAYIKEETAGEPGSPRRNVSMYTCYVALASVLQVQLCIIHWARPGTGSACLLNLILV